MARIANPIPDLDELERFAEMELYGSGDTGPFAASTVLNLIAEVRRLRAENNRLRKQIWSEKKG